MAGLFQAVTNFADAPGGANPLADADVAALRATFGTDQGAMFRAGFDTRQIAQVVNWTEAMVHNAKQYREAPHA